MVNVYFSHNFTFYDISQKYQYNTYSVETVPSFCFTVFLNTRFLKHLKRFCCECEHTLFQGVKAILF